MSHPDLSNQEKLEEVYRLTVENNHLLHKIQSRERIALVFRVVYWLAILGALGGAYYYVRPFFEGIAANSSKAESVLHQFEELRSQIPNSSGFKQLIDQIRHPDSSASSTETSAAEE
jgi:hypothetical protein